MNGPFPWFHGHDIEAPVQFCGISLFGNPLFACGLDASLGGVANSVQRFALTYARFHFNEDDKRTLSNDQVDFTKRVSRTAGNGAVAFKYKRDQRQPLGTMAFAIGRKTGILRFVSHRSFFMANARA